MFRMEVDDSSPDVSGNTPSPRDRIIQRLTLVGMPRESLELLELGVVAYVKDNRSHVSEIVSAILPADEEAVEAALESQSVSYQFHESMTWLQWLMFEGDPDAALLYLEKMNVGQRGVCGAVWGNNDIAYRCRTCEHDPTCAICVPCFQNGNHKDHDYSIIYTGGGCCDCGDVTAWKREGFCSEHKGAEQIQLLPGELADSVGPILDSLFNYWKTKLLLAESLSRGSPQVNDNVAEHKKVTDEMTCSVVEMLLKFCRCSESLLSFISRKVLSSVGLLDILVRAERFSSDDVFRKLHELLLKLLGEPLFKYEFAKVFLSYYPTVISEAIKECDDNVFKKYPLLSIFSVQIYTVPTLTPQLVREMNLLAMLLECLGDIFVSCAEEDGRLQVNKWGNLYETTHRVVEDIRFVMSHSVVPKYVTRDRRDLSRTWMKLLAFVQGMNPLKRETGIHVEEENENMHFPFVLCHSLADIHSLLVAGAFSLSTEEETEDVANFNTCKQEFEDQDALRHAKVGRLSQESSVSSGTGRTNTLDSFFKPSEAKHAILPVPASVTWLTFECLRAIENWLGMDNTSGPLLNVLSPKTTNASGNNFLALRRTLSKIRRSRHIFKSYSAPLSNSKLATLRDSDGKRYSSPARISLGDSAQNNGQEPGSSGSDDSVEGDIASELEALRVLCLSDWPDITYDVSSQDISVHIPLHRFLSLVLQKALKRCYCESASPNLISAGLTDSLSSTSIDFFGHILGGCHPYGFSAFVMEHPLRIRVFCAEVHAGMWRKNGDAAILSYEWYRSVRWSEQGLELDLFLLQCCAALAPSDLFLSRIVERFGLSSYLSLNLEFSSEYEPILVQEMLTLIIQMVKERRFCGLTTVESLKRELIYKLSVGDATRSQLVKSLPRDLSKVDQLQEILDTIALYSNPSGMNQGMYKLQRTYWKDLDLYHPRWNSRDLQVAEERYMRFCNISAVTTQVPKWTKIYSPLSGMAKIATCKVVAQIVRAVAFYAVYTDKSTASRSPDGVLLKALHLLSLALDVCAMHMESGDESCNVGNSIPILAFAGEEIGAGINKRFGDQCLLSLLVSLMRIHKKENHDQFMEASNFNLYSLIVNLLKKFAQLDFECMTKLQKLAPDFICQLSQSTPSFGDKSIMGSASDGDKRKAEARERQAAMLEKMRAQQSKFLASINSPADEDRSKFGEVCSSDVDDDSEDTTQVVCSLCHDPTSKNPVSFLILLQKSKLQTSVDRGPPRSWEKDHQSDEHVPMNTDRMGISSKSTTARSSEIISSQLMHLIQNAVNEFASDGQPRELNAFVEFIKARFPSAKDIQLPCMSAEMREKTAYDLEILEEQMYLLIHEGINGNYLPSNMTKNKEFSSAGGDPMRSEFAEPLLLGKYIAALSKETLDNPSASENAGSLNDKRQLESTSPLSAHSGFRPFDCDGIHISSCGHAVHQGCLDPYLSSLKERYIRRIVFEGGHIVDPDRGEFLCPVCRGLANSVLPASIGVSKKASKPLAISNSVLSDAIGLLTTFENSLDSLHIQQALSLLQCAADVSGKSEILKAFPMQQSGRIIQNLESAFRVLCGMYFPGKQDKVLGSSRINLPMIMWDTLKYSLISSEITARSGKTSLTPCYGLNKLYNELKSSTGFILSLLLKTVQSIRTKNSLSVLLRLRGILLYAASICSGVSLDGFPRQMHRQEGDMLRILENTEMEGPFPDIQFWRQASDPILAHDAFSSLMWILFCLPYPFLSCEKSFLSLVHILYAVSVTQAIIIYCGKLHCNLAELGYNDCLIADVSLFLRDYGIMHQYFVSSHTDSSCDIKDLIRRLSFPYLRRSALLWKLVNSSTSVPFSDESNVLERMEFGSCDMEEIAEIEELEKIFKIPSLDVVLKDQELRSLVSKWLHHFSKDFECRPHHSILHLTPVVPFKLLSLPYLYQDLLERYIKQRCPDCGVVKEDLALCLLCGKLCSPNWKACCSESKCHNHAIGCGAGTGVFLLIRKTTILLQRSQRQAPWPSLYLDAFGEEDIEMNRGKPLYLNEERYAALSHMVASHGLDRSSKVLRQTTIGAFFMF